MNIPQDQLLRLMEDIRHTLCLDSRKKRSLEMVTKMTKTSLGTLPLSSFEVTVKNPFNEERTDRFVYFTLNEAVERFCE